MPSNQSVDERAAIEIARQLPIRAKAVAAGKGVPLGYQPVSDRKAAELWWQRDQTVDYWEQRAQGLSPEDATWKCYPHRKPILDEVGGVEAQLAFTNRMNRMQPGAPPVEDGGQSYDTDE